ncbi:hypothetical protein [Flavobacterium sp.]|uniref:hypothetical protein n=1 Tax=Flavobacterium sp. TaxID=239 RepID=UPI00261052A7|nr:hypothetical protein [Flavobacterium sp.]
MKTLHKINVIALITTLLLYITVLLGMYAQILLGPLQLIIALIVSYSYYKKLSPRLQKGIILYWIAAVTSLTITYFSWLDYRANDFIIITLFVIPMLIACYFARLTYCITKYLNITQP